MDIKVHQQKSVNDNSLLQSGYDMYEQLCKSEKNDFASNLIQTLMNIIAQSKEQTMQGLTHVLKNSAEYIIEQAEEKGILGTKTNLSLKSVASIFLHYINRGLRQYGGDNMEDMKQNLQKIANELLQITSNSKQKINTHALEFLQNGITILIYGASSVVASCLLYGASKGIKFQCLICETRPLCEGYKMYKKLCDKIPCKLIVDSAIGVALEEADIVLTGAEAVVENGGIINRIGSYTVALCAHALKRPFYVVCESFKFTRMFPLSQKDLPQNVQDSNKIELLSNQDIQKSDMIIKNPICDYTPPNFITLLFTDVGIFTPSAVSDELIQIFNT